MNFVFVVRTDDGFLAAAGSALCDFAAMFQAHGFETEEAAWGLVPVGRNWTVHRVPDQHVGTVGHYACAKRVDR